MELYYKKRQEQGCHEGDFAVFGFGELDTLDFTGEFDVKHDRHGQQDVAKQGEEGIELKEREDMVVCGSVGG